MQKKQTVIQNIAGALRAAVRTAFYVFIAFLLFITLILRDDKNSNQRLFIGRKRPV